MDYIAELRSKEFSKSLISINVIEGCHFLGKDLLGPL